jgi:FtsP/CotA-like multicopper oxidase with cupredoxin domain
MRAMFSSSRGARPGVEARGQFDALMERVSSHGDVTIEKVPTDVDGAAEEGTPIPAHSKRRFTFTARSSGFRFYHTHNRAGANLYAGQYGGEVGPVYIEPEHEPGRYDREVFLVLKEFEPTFSRGGDMPQDFLSPATRKKELEDAGESAMWTINGVAYPMTGESAVAFHLQRGKAVSIAHAQR